MTVCVRRGAAGKQHGQGGATRRHQGRGVAAGPQQSGLAERGRGGAGTKAWSRQRWGCALCKCMSACGQTLVRRGFAPVRAQRHSLLRRTRVRAWPARAGWVGRRAPRGCGARPAPRARGAAGGGRLRCSAGARRRRRGWQGLRRRSGARVGAFVRLMPKVGENEARQRPGSAPCRRRAARACACACGERGQSSGPGLVAHGRVPGS